MAAAAVGPAGAAPPGGAAALGPAGAVDPAAYMQSFVSNPAFMQMAERLGSTMMRDPAVSQIVSQMSSPGQMAEMKAKMEARPGGRCCALPPSLCLADFNPHPPPRRRS